MGARQCHALLCHAISITLLSIHPLRERVSSLTSHNRHEGPPTTAYLFSRIGQEKTTRQSDCPSLSSGHDTSYTERSDPIPFVSAIGDRGGITLSDYEIGEDEGFLTFSLPALGLRQRDTSLAHMSRDS